MKIGYMNRKEKQQSMQWNKFLFYNTNWLNKAKWICSIRLITSRKNWGVKNILNNLIICRWGLLCVWFSECDVLRLIQNQHNDFYFEFFFGHQYTWKFRTSYTNSNEWNYRKHCNVFFGDTKFSNFNNSFHMNSY